MPFPPLDPCAPVPIDIGGAARPVHSAVRHAVRHPHGPAGAAHPHAYAPVRHHIVMVKPAGCGAAGWLFRGLGAAGLGGGAIGGDDLSRAFLPPPDAAPPPPDGTYGGPGGTGPFFPPAFELVPAGGGIGAHPPTNVPEPSALVMFGFACVALLLWRRAASRRMRVGRL